MHRYFTYIAFFYFRREVSDFIVAVVPSLSCVTEDAADENDDDDNAVD